MCVECESTSRHHDFKLSEVTPITQNPTQEIQQQLSIQLYFMLANTTTITVRSFIESHPAF